MCSPIRTYVRTYARAPVRRGRFRFGPHDLRGNRRSVARLTRPAAVPAPSVSPVLLLLSSQQYDYDCNFRASKNERRRPFPFVLITIYTIARKKRKKTSRNVRVLEPRPPAYITIRVRISVRSKNVKWLHYRKKKIIKYALDMLGITIIVIIVFPIIRKHFALTKKIHAFINEVCSKSTGT